MDDTKLTNEEEKEYQKLLLKEIPFSKQKLVSKRIAARNNDSGILRRAWNSFVNLTRLSDKDQTAIELGKKIDAKEELAQVNAALNNATKSDLKAKEIEALKARNIELDSYIRSTISPLITDGADAKEDYDRIKLAKLIVRATRLARILKSDKEVFTDQIDKVIDGVPTKTEEAQANKELKLEKKNNLSLLDEAVDDYAKNNNKPLPTDKPSEYIFNKTKDLFDSNVSKNIYKVEDPATKEANIIASLDTIPDIYKKNVKIAYDNNNVQSLKLYANEAGINDLGAKKTIMAAADFIEEGLKKEDASKDKATNVKAAKADEVRASLDTIPKAYKEIVQDAFDSKDIRSLETYARSLGISDDKGAKTIANAVKFIQGNTLNEEPQQAKLVNLKTKNPEVYEIFNDSTKANQIVTSIIYSELNGSMDNEDFKNLLNGNVLNNEQIALIQFGIYSLNKEMINNPEFASHIIGKDTTEILSDKVVDDKLTANFNEALNACAIPNNIVNYREYIEANKGKLDYSSIIKGNDINKVYQLLLNPAELDINAQLNINNALHVEQEAHKDQIVNGIAQMTKNKEKADLSSILKTDAQDRENDKMKIKNILNADSQNRENEKAKIKNILNEDTKNRKNIKDSIKNILLNDVINRQNELTQKSKETLALDKVIKDDAKERNNEITVYKNGKEIEKSLDNKVSEAKETFTEDASKAEETKEEYASKLGLSKEGLKYLSEMATKAFISGSSKINTTDIIALSKLSDDNEINAKIEQSFADKSIYKSITKDVQLTALYESGLIKANDVDDFLNSKDCKFTSTVKEKIDANVLSDKISKTKDDTSEYKYTTVASELYKHAEKYGNVSNIINKVNDPDFSKYYTDYEKDRNEQKETIKNVAQTIIASRDNLNKLNVIDLTMATENELSKEARKISRSGDKETAKEVSNLNKTVTDTIARVEDKKKTDEDLAHEVYDVHKLNKNTSTQITGKNGKDTVIDNKKEEEKYIQNKLNNRPDALKVYNGLLENDQKNSARDLNELKDFSSSNNLLQDLTNKYNEATNVTERNEILKEIRDDAKLSKTPINKVLDMMSNYKEPEEYVNVDVPKQETVKSK